MAHMSVNPLALYQVFSGYPRCEDRLCPSTSAAGGADSCADVAFIAANLVVGAKAFDFRKYFAVLSGECGHEDHGAVGLDFEVDGVFVDGEIGQVDAVR